MDGIRDGGFEVENPYNRRRRQVPARPHEVHSIVFWSKNYGPFLRQRIGERLAARGYHFFFNFSLNSTTPLLEPHVPPLNDRLQQLEELVQRFGPQVLVWRFDPICFFCRRPRSATENNLDQMAVIAAAAARLGIRQCITSFVDLYPKVQHRARRVGVRFEDPPKDAKAAILQQMAAVLRDFDIDLHTCCENEIAAHLPPAGSIRSGACIPGERLARLFGPNFRRQRDRGQRVDAGCGCNAAIDIGSYNRQPCYHNCLFCYARPQVPLTPHRSANSRPACHANRNHHRNP